MSDIKFHLIFSENAFVLKLTAKTFLLLPANFEIHLDFLKRIVNKI